MSAYDELHYPNLTNCEMKIVSSTATGAKPPVSLPSNCLSAAKMSLTETPYDFSLGKRTLLVERESR
jgi:hypothetical protein